MKAVKGNELDLRVERLANHDIMCAGSLTGWRSQAEEAAYEAGRWISKPF